MDESQSGGDEDRTVVKILLPSGPIERIIEIVAWLGYKNDDAVLAGSRCVIVAVPLDTVSSSCPVSWTTAALGSRAPRPRVEEDLI